MEGIVIDWARTRPDPDPRLPVSWLTPAQKAAELQRIQRARAREAAREAEPIPGLAAGGRFRMDPDGTLHVTTPSGVTRTTRPPGRRPPDEPPPAEPAGDPPR